MYVSLQEYNNGSAVWCGTICKKSQGVQDIARCVRNRKVYQKNVQMHIHRVLQCSSVSDPKHKGRVVRRSRGLGRVDCRHFQCETHPELRVLSETPSTGRRLNLHMAPRSETMKVLGERTNYPLSLRPKLPRQAKMKNDTSNMLLLSERESQLPPTPSSTTSSTEPATLTSTNTAASESKSSNFKSADIQCKIEAQSAEATPPAARTPTPSTAGESPPHTSLGSAMSTSTKMAEAKTSSVTKATPLEMAAPSVDTQCGKRDNGTTSLPTDATVLIPSLECLSVRTESGLSKIGNHELLRIDDHNVAIVSLILREAAVPCPCDRLDCRSFIKVGPYAGYALNAHEGCVHCGHRPFRCMAALRNHVKTETCRRTRSNKSK